MKDIEIFGLRVSIYDAGKNEKTGRSFEKGISLSMGQNYMRLSALQFVGMSKLISDPDVQKELRIRVKEEKAKMEQVDI